MLDDYLTCVSLITNENNVTVALNDAIESLVIKASRNDVGFIGKIINQSTKKYKNDYKYNFLVPKKILADFNIFSKQIGINPCECLRKILLVYILKNSSVKK